MLWNIATTLGIVSLGLIVHGLVMRVRDLEGETLTQHKRIKELSASPEIENNLHDPNPALTYLKRKAATVPIEEYKTQQAQKFKNTPKVQVEHGDVKPKETLDLAGHAFNKAVRAVEALPGPKATTHSITYEYGGEPTRSHVGGDYANDKFKLPISQEHDWRDIAKGSRKPTETLGTAMGPKSPREPLEGE